MANQKRISELPIINTLSGSAVSVIPVVVGGTTNQISAERFSEFVNAYNATTASNSFIGDQTITGDLTITGDIRAERYYIENISSSVIYESGSTLFGNSGDDTHTFTGSILLNGSALGQGELNAQTASQDLVNLQISSTTGSINTTTSSFDSVFLQISSTTGSINTTTSSFDSVFFGISSVTGAMNTQSSSQDLVNLQISSTTGSINTTTSSFDSVFLGVSVVTGSLNDFTASVLGQTTDLATITSSVHFATQSLNTQTGSQNSLNTSLGIITSSIYGEITSFNSVFSGVSAVTGAFATELGQLQTQNTSQGGVNTGLSAVTGAFATELGQLQTQNTSQGLINNGISAVTGAFANELGGIQTTLDGHRGELNGIEAWTASLDSIYATDAQVADAVAGLNTQTGSQNSINTGISAVTGAFATELGQLQTQNTSQGSVNSGISAVTGAFSTELGQLQTQNTSQGSVNSGISAVTGAFTTELGQLQTQNTSQGSVNSGISAVTGAFATELGSIQSNITSFNNVFSGVSAVTGAFATELDGIQTSLTQFSGIEAYTSSLKSVLTINGGDVEFSGKLTAQEIHTTFTTSSVLFQSGSTKFGDSVDDKHEFTGSLRTHGSVSGSSLQASQLYIDVESRLNTGAPLKLYNTTNTNRWDLYHYTDNTLRLNYNGSGGDEFTLFSDGGVNFSGDITGSSVISRKSSTDTTFGDVPNIQVINTATATTNQYSGIRYRFEDGTYNGNSFIGALRESGTSNGHSLILAPANTGGGNPSEGLRVNSSGNVSVNSTSNTAKFRVYNPTNDGTYGSKIQAVFGVNDYLDSDATNIFGGGITETQFGNGATNRPAVISLGGNLNANETLGVINFFSSTNDDGYRSRANIHGAYINTGTAGKYGGELRFMVAADNVTNPQESFRLAYDGDVKVLTGNLVIGTSGKGIDFSATGNAAGMTSELLDDYEEGTWTPEVIGSTGTPTSVTYNYQGGSYTKIGNTVWIRMGVNIANVGTGGTGTLQVTGLPFTPRTEGAYQEPTSMAMGGRWVTSGNAGNVYGFVKNSEAKLEFRTMASNADTALAYSELQGGGESVGTWFTIVTFYHV